MSVKEETYLQQRIQTLIQARGGYVSKNHGSMITAPGLHDLHGTYRGCPFYFEVKIPPNTPSREQGIHCRAVKKAGALSAIITSTKQVELLLNQIDLLYTLNTGLRTVYEDLYEFMEMVGIEDGTTY